MIFYQLIEDRPWIECNQLKFTFMEFKKSILIYKEPDENLPD